MSNAPDENVVPGMDKTTCYLTALGRVRVMSWVVLIFSGLFETVWAAALAASKGLSKLYPSLVFLGALVVSMGGLGYALRDIPVGTGYAVWVGIGAIGTALWGMAALNDPVTIGRITCLVLIIAGVVGLQLLR